jgi:hypothetical protein
VTGSILRERVERETATVDEDGAGARLPQFELGAADPSVSEAGGQGCRRYSEHGEE